MPKMMSSRPYLLRALYEWIVDNRLTPYVLVDAEFVGVQVPSQFIEDGKIILNVSPNAVVRLAMKNEALEFDASFSGTPYHIYVPILAIESIYAYENGRGMFFDESEQEVIGGSGDGDGDFHPPAGGAPDTNKGRPQLKIVK
jgi:stringent starvation protein B